MLAPCDFWVFSSLKNLFGGSFFDDPEALRSVIEEGLVDLNIGH
jgi:hypothetical protein